MEDALKKYNIHYVPQYKYTIGFMDFFIPDSNIAVFVDGTIWHADPKIYQTDDLLFFGKTAQQVWEKDLHSGLLYYFHMSCIRLLKNNRWWIDKLS